MKQKLRWVERERGMADLSVLNLSLGCVEPLLEGMLDYLKMLSFRSAAYLSPMALKILAIE